MHSTSSRTIICMSKITSLSSRESPCQLSSRQKKQCCISLRFAAGVVTVCSAQLASYPVPATPSFSSLAVLYCKRRKSGRGTGYEASAQLDTLSMDAQQPWKKGGTTSWMAAAGALESSDLEPRLQLLHGHMYHCLPATSNISPIIVPF